MMEAPAPLKGKEGRGCLRGRKQPATCLHLRALQRNLEKRQRNCGSPADIEEDSQVIEPGCIAGFSTSHVNSL